MVGDDRAKRDDAPVGDVLIEVRVSRDFIEPPDWIGIRVGMTEKELVIFDAAGGEIFGKPFFNPFFEVNVRDFAVQLVHSFVKHPMVRIHLFSRIVSAAIRFAVESLRPAEPRIDPSHFGAVSVEKQLQARMDWSECWES